MYHYRRIGNDGSGDSELIGIVPSKRRWERKQRARDRQVKFQGQPSQVITREVDHIVLYLLIFNDCFF